MLFNYTIVQFLTTSTHQFFYLFLTREILFYSVYLPKFALIYLRKVFNDFYTSQSLVSKEVEHDAYQL